jgi:hypothetical protein
VTKDCRNDCVDPLRFPRVVFNRPGLSRIKYRLGSYADIRKALLRNLDQTPGLSQWTHRGGDDPGIALLEGASILGDILTFYQELYANEAYLRTAQWRDSIADLVRLLGYRLSPGLGGHATFAFEITGDAPVTIPSGFPIKAEVAGIEKPADFETGDPAVAYPWLSRFNVFRPLVQPLVTAATSEFYIDTPDQLTSPVVLRQGDRLLVGVGDPGAPGRINNSETVVVDSTRVLHGTTLIKIKGGLQSGTNTTVLVAYKLGRTFRHFGHNGPRTKIIPPVKLLSTSLTSGDPIPLLIPLPEVTIPVPEVTVQIAAQPIPVPAGSVQGPPLKIPVEGNTGNFLASVRIPSATPQVIEVLPGPPGFPPNWSINTTAITVPTPSVAVPASSVTAPASSVTVPASSVKTTPSPLQFTPPRPPPLQTLMTTNLPPLAEVSINFFRSLNSATSTSAQTIIEPTLGATEFPLDADVQDLSAGVAVIAQFPAFTNASHTLKEERTVVRTIGSIRPISVTWGLLSSNTTLVTLGDTLGTTTDLSTDIREFEFQETLSPQLTLKAAMQEDPGTTEGVDLLYYGSDSQAEDLKNRRVMFEKPGATTFDAVVTAVEKDSSLLATRQLVRRIKLDKKVTYADFPNLKPFVTVYGNLVDASQGKSETAVPLGNGDNRLVFQSFKVPKAPVTYLISDTDTPPEVPELQIYINDRLWKRVPSFFDRRPEEEIYIVREDTDNNSWVQFGDGVTGSRLPSGVKNVVAKSRTGTGAFGALKPDTKVQAGGRLERLDKIQMPDVAAGGSRPEDGDNAREAAPGKVQSLDRLVSVEDFESETLAISGVTKASAAWQLVHNIPEIVVTVLMETGRGDEFTDVRTTLAGYSRGRGSGRNPIAVLQGYLEYVVINATFGYDSTYREEDIRKAVQKALGINGGKPNVVDDQSGLFSVRRRGFGQREYITSIAGTIQKVAGVTWAYVTRFESLGVVPDPTVLTPPSAAIAMQAIVGCDNQNVLSLYVGHLQLAGVAEAVAEVKP